jgi:hypothetical protein
MGSLRDDIADTIAQDLLDPDGFLAERARIWPDGKEAQAFDAIVLLGGGGPTLVQGSYGDVAVRAELSLLAQRSAIEAGMQTTTGTVRMLRQGDLIVVPPGSDHPGTWLVQWCHPARGGALKGSVRQSNPVSVSAADVRKV